MYPFIPEAGVQDFDKLVLRAGFNDRVRATSSTGRRATYIRDQVIRDLHADMGRLVAHGGWCLLWVNADYKGLYNITERIDEEFLDAHALGNISKPDTSSDEEDSGWDIVKTGSRLVSGTKAAWNDLKRFIEDNDVADSNHYEAVGRRVDLGGLIDYVILNLWAQNEDWPHNNWYAFRARPHGRMAIHEPGMPSSGSDLAHPERMLALTPTSNRRTD